MDNQQGFLDKVVSVTGASAGIGEATARAFAAQGAKVVLADIYLSIFKMQV
jgi:NADP-dependent 3-hydroxy acid dehydrogenase YdfG